MAYQEIEVDIYRKERGNIKSMLNVATIRNYHGTAEGRTKILFKAIDILVIDEPYDKFKERMAYFQKDA